jgi:hypothetical protein
MPYNTLMADGSTPPASFSSSDQGLTGLRETLRNARA